jgi:SHS family sialic acid transporter-like MFS transporter
VSTRTAKIVSTPTAKVPWWTGLDRSHWNAMLGSWLGWALDGFDFILITYVLTNIATTFHVSLAAAGTLVLAAFATRWLGGAVLGSMADRLGRKKAMIVGILVYSIATFMCGLSWSYWSLLGFRLLVGFGMGGEYSAGTTLLLETWPARMRNKASGFLVSGWAVGGMLASLVYAPIVTNFGWRALFFVGILPAFLAIYVRRTLSETPEFTAAMDNATATQPKVSFFQLFSRRWLPMTITMFVMMFASFGMNWPILSLLPTYLKTIGYTPGAVGHFMFIASFGALLGYWFSGFLADWIGIRWAFVSTLLVSLGFVALTFLVAGLGSGVVLGILLFALEFTNLGITGLFPKYITDHFGVEVRAAGLGVTYNLGAIAGGLSPILGALLGGAIGLGPAIGVLTLFWTFVTMIIIGFRIPARVAARRVDAVQPFQERRVSVE